MLLFHRFLQPLTILMALPLSVGGAFIGLIVTGSSMSMPAMIGLILLMGIATKTPFYWWIMPSLLKMNKA